MANLYVGKFKKDFVYNPDISPSLPNIIDVFLSWDSTPESLIEFHNLLNTWNANLKFTLEHSPDRITFLDVSIYKHDNRLKLTIYRKPTDRNTLLPVSSYHPSSLKDNLPTGQFMRLCRLFSDKHDFVAKSVDMKSCFLERG